MSKTVTSHHVKMTQPIGVRNFARGIITHPKLTATPRFDGKTAIVTG